MILRNICHCEAVQFRRPAPALNRGRNPYFGKEIASHRTLAMTVDTLDEFEKHYL
jgi:hypothetical protein